MSVEKKINNLERFFCLSEAAAGGALKNFTNFRGKHLWWNLFLIKFQVSKPTTLLERGSNTAVSAKPILRTTILKTF